MDNTRTADAAELREWEAFCKQRCRSRTLVVLHQHGEGQFIEWKKSYSPALAAEIRKHYGDDLKEIINERYL